MMTSENSFGRRQLPWRWLLILSETLVACFTVFIKLAERHEGTMSPSPIIDGAVGVAIIFLFFGSPFLVRSQGGLAILGWLIAAAAVLEPIL